MPKDMIADVKIEALAGKPVELPNGDFVANAEMTRSGMDLHLTSGGHTIVVEGYFAQHPAPDLVTHDGARLTPAMVDAFVPPEHAGQYAASGQITNDASPAGKITQVVGDATIIHADGTKVAATTGALIYQGDVIETSKTGAVNIQFADNTTFAISESARMSVDQFVYHPADHSGSTFFSMLQGVFVYTSGLIGKHDAGAVNIETPVGSIGIRGTVVAGTIAPAGHPSQITILDGAITVTNAAGTQEMNNSLQTVSLNGYQSQAQSVPMDAQTFTQSYHSVSSVAGETITHFTGAPSPAPGSQTEHTPAGAAPPAAGSETAPAPAGATAPAPQHAAPTAPAPTAPEGTAPTGSAAPAPSATTTTIAATDTVIAPPPPTSTFTSTTNTSSFSTTSGTTSFTTPTTTTTASAPATTDSSSTTTTTSAGAGTTTTTTAPPPPPPLAVGLAHDTGFSFSDNYTSNPALKVTGNIAGATIQYNVDNGGWVNTAPSSLADGLHTVIVQELDAKNNVIATSSLLTFTLDTAAGPTPSVALSVDTSGGSGITSNGTLVLGGGIETNARIQFSTDGGTTWSGPILPGALPTTWAQGANTVQIRQIDQAGNISGAGSVSFTYDSISPAAPTVTLAVDTGSSTTDHITSNPNLSISGGLTPLYSSNGTSGWSATPPSAVEGLNTVYVEQVDAAGNVSPVTTFQFTLDTTAPVAPTVSLAVDSGSSTTDKITNNAALNIGHESGAVVEYSSDGIAWSSTVPTWAQGSNTVYVRQTDAAGNVSTASAPFTFTYASGITLSPVSFSPAYNAIDAVKSNAGIADFAPIGTVVGTVAPSSLPAGDSIVSYSIAVDNSGSNHPMEVVPGVSPSGAYTTQALANPNTAFSIDSSGVITVNNPMVLLNSLNSNLILDITATDAAGNTYTLHQTVVIANDGTFSNIGVENGTTVGSLIGTSGADLLYVANDTAGMTIKGLGGADVLLGGTGIDYLTVADGTFKEVDGGAGYNHLVLDTIGTGLSNFNVDFTNAGTGIVRNISELDLASNSTGAEGAILNLQSIYNMTPGGSGAHTLTVMATDYTALHQSTLSVVGGGLSGFLLTSGVWGVTPTLTYTGTVSGSTVTLNVQEFVSPYDSITSSGGILVIDGNHTATPTMVSTTPAAGTSGADFLIDVNPNTLGGTPNPFTTLGTYSILSGNGGSDILIGSAGDNMISVTDGTFQLIDGGAGYDRLAFATTSTPISLDFTTQPHQTVRNIEEIDLNSGTGSIGNNISLDIKNIFDMTGSNSTLRILETNTGSIGSGVTIHTSDVNGTLTYDSANSTSNALGTAAGDVHYTGTYQGHTVTLVVTEANASGAGHVGITTV